MLSHFELRQGKKSIYREDAKNAKISKFFLCELRAFAVKF
jgi:hypothetical protein